MALLQHTGPASALHWLRARGAQSLATDSRHLRPGDAFIAWPGYAFDARQFVPAALEAGAAACLVEAHGVEAFGFSDERIAALEGLKKHTGEIASGFFGEPSRELKLLAVTGTNGKTSTAWWTAQALGLLQGRCGLIGTLGIGEPGQLELTGLTTPDPVALQSSLRGFVDRGFSAAAIEASSIGIAEERLAGSRIAVAQFTNFSRDHLDYHGSMEAYWEAKARLFAWPQLRAAVVNLDDERGAALAARLALNSGLALWTYSALRPARLRATGLQYGEGGLGFELLEGETSVPVRTRLIGDYNAGNLLAVAGALRSLGLPLPDIADAFSRLSPVPGRMQRLPGEPGIAGPEVIVDYAHTPDALEKALHALQPLARERGGRLWCVFGCGGSRDATKRPLMGAIAERLADQVVVTSDNPRLEAPCFILSQILAGVVGHDDVAVIEDRAEAIAHAVSSAAPADVVLLAGKGHEDYQEIAGVKRPFSDAEQALLALRARAGAGPGA